MFVSNPPSAEPRIDPSVMFSDSNGNPSSSMEKRQRQLLQKISFINGFLESDETLLLVVPCVSPTRLLEQFVNGWIFSYLNRALLVVTDKGIFHLPTNIDFSWRHSIAKIRYANCKRLRIIRRGLLIEYANGEKDRFLHLPMSVRKKLRSYFSRLHLSDSHNTSIGRAHLCPRCATPLAAAVYQCAGCQLDFKDEATSAKMSTFIPGGGYFYTGHPYLGAVSLAIGLFFLALIGISLGDVFAGNSSSLWPAIFFAILLRLEMCLTRDHAQRYISEYIPQVQAAQQLLPSDSSARAA